MSSQILQCYPLRETAPLWRKADGMVRFRIFVIEFSFKNNRSSCSCSASAIIFRPGRPHWILTLSNPYDAPNPTSEVVPSKYRLFLFQALPVCPPPSNSRPIAFFGTAIQVCVVHLRSSAGTLPRQHVFLHSAVGAMATMNLTKNPSDPSFSPRNRDDRGAINRSARTGKTSVADLHASNVSPHCRSTPTPDLPRAIESVPCAV